MKGRGTKARRRLLFWCPLRQWMQDSTDTTRFFGSGTMSLTVDAEGTATTVSDAGSIKHTHRPIVFEASLLRRERGPLPTTQCAVRLREKILPSQACYSRCTRPLRGTQGWYSSWREVWGRQRFNLRGGQTR